MNEVTAKAYQVRMNSVVDYIHDHLSENPSVEELSRVAHFSKFHFHRQFSGYIGISVLKYIQLIRLRRASWRLAFRRDDRIIAIAMSAGFENPESFTRAFKKTFGQTPSQFRKLPDWQAWRDKYQFLNNERIRHMQAGKHNKQVNIVEFKQTRVAVLEHRGAADHLNDTISKFIRWRKESGLSPKTGETYNIVYDGPGNAAADEFRLDLCAAVNADVKPNPYGVITRSIPAGRCAVLRHIGPDDNIGASINYLYAEWLPQSGEELRDFPCFFHRVSLFPDVPEHEMITDIYLPLA